jgi:hypothetical protein
MHNLHKAVTRKITTTNCQPAIYDKKFASEKMHAGACITSAYQGAAGKRRIRLIYRSG